MVFQVQVLTLSPLKNPQLQLFSHQNPTIQKRHLYQDQENTHTKLSLKLKDSSLELSHEIS